VSTPQTYTITSTDEYSTLDGSKRFTFTAGTVIPMSLAIEMGLTGAGYDAPVYFTEAETAVITAGELSFHESLHFAMTAANLTIGTANTAALNLFRLARPVTVNKVRIYVGTTDAAGFVDVGYYQSDGTTLTPLWRSGSTAIGATNAVQEFSPTSFELPAGVDLYEALVTSSTTATFRGGSSGGPSLGLYGKRLVAVASALPLPASITLASTTASNRLFWIYAGPA
jgi:hypothetical protein